MGGYGALHDMRVWWVVHQVLFAPCAEGEKVFRVPCRRRERFSWGLRGAVVFWGGREGGSALAGGFGFVHGGERGRVGAA